MGRTTASVRKNLGRKNDGQVHLCSLCNVSIKILSVHERSNKHRENIRSIQDSNNDPLNVQASSLNRNKTTIPFPVDYCTEIVIEPMLGSDVTMEISHISKEETSQTGINARLSNNTES